jgi:murein L,D-transpeptidase YafK/ketosteroid isomerase-like protein
MKRPGCAIALLCLLLLPCRQAAGEWTADIVDLEWSPSRFVTVDKKAQSFTLLTRQSPLRVIEAIPCATGQELGDKYKEGDLKTPEGVYFITRRKTAGLNYELYGDLAFPLNFPNPADMVRRKSGHGIWIHGRGHAIIPFETQGCVAMNTPDLHRMDQQLAEGMPVVIADEVRIGSDAATLRGEAREVVEATKGWAKAWQDRSEAFFGYHDAEKFSLTSGQAFAAFKSHKERLFKALPWIQVTLSDVRAIAGPDYWVTYFVQVYRSPTLVSQGVKRLYWQRGADGRFRVIGMEYEEAPVTMVDKGGKPNHAAPYEAEADTRKPDSPSEEEVQVRQLVDANQAIMEKVAQKAFHAVTLKRQPSPEDQAILEVAETGAVKPGVSPFASDAMKQAPPPPAQPAPAAPVKAEVPASPAPPVVVAAAQTAPPAAKPTPAPVKANPVSPERAAEIAATVEGWRAAWERGRLDDYMAFYADGARQGNSKGKEAIRSQKAGVWRNLEPGRVGVEIVSIGPAAEGFEVVCAETYQAKGRRESKGFKTLVLVASGPKLLIASERWSKGRPAPASPEAALAGKDIPVKAQAPAAAPPAAPVQAAAPQAVAASPVAAQPAAPAPVPSVPPKPVAQVAPTAAAAPVAAGTPAPVKTDQPAAVAAMIETWRDAWERGRAFEYASFYADNAVQGDRRGREAIRRQKADMWKDAKAPKRVRLSDVKITPRKDGFAVTCVQDYESQDGTADRGIKTLVLVPAGDSFAIAEEKWSRQ